MMFNDQYGLTQAVLDGRKTMTRRIASPSNDRQISLANLNKEWYEDDGGNTYISMYEVGEIIAIAMSYEHIFYELLCSLPDECGVAAGWRNKMFVKAEYMPYKIKITNIRAEPLQCISDDNCLKEGINEDSKGIQYSFSSNIGYCGQYPFDTPREAFAALIDKVSGKGTWERNPFVWVYEFELIN